MTVESIEDTKDFEKEYIKDLESEIDSLRKEIKKYKRLLNTAKMVNVSVKELKEMEHCEHCLKCDKYKILLKSFHKLLDDILPF